jgi:nucleotide-binding universal stress UspA family protein
MAVFDKILVPVDGSRPSGVGVALAIELAKQYGHELFFVNIVDLGATAMAMDDAALDVTEIAAEAHAEGERLVNAAAESARAQGLAAEVAVLEGPVLNRLLDASVDSHATSIVMGSHGRGGLARLLKGSTTDGLLRRSAVPVIVAPRGTPRHPSTGDKAIK